MRSDHDQRSEGGKWKTSLLYAISEGILRPRDLWRAIPGSTKRVLNQPFKELEEFHILTKKVYNKLTSRFILF